ncbi:hypothetical protein CBR_g37488 [Chara braunii]|uniref:Uncharacterized protein n=1 Tax=Chara braunii TaxID=69332 RepID=A0A388LMY7_CHABU|nr:hypothetical protein CBR_g37488 [Chara braunii]|eukprot:GBG83687.1 hypothetical protein CBR_g37488 [Chara braunii]
MKPCALQTDEIVHTLVVGGAKVQPNDKNTKYLLRNYKGGEAESDVHRDHAPCGEEGLEDPQTDKPQPLPVAGRGVAGIANMLVDALDEAVEGGGAAEDGGGEEGQGSTTRMTTLRQTTVRRWVDNAAQKKLDIAWAEAMFRAVPTTTYVGRRSRRQDRDFEVEPTPVVDRVDMDVEFLLHRHDDPDEEEATRAKEMADRDRELMDRRIAEEEARRAAIPTRRERERRAAQQEKHGGEALKEMDGDVQPAMDKGEQKQGEPVDVAEEQQAAVAVYTRKPRPCVEQEVGAEGETTDQQVAISERGKEQQEEPQAAKDISTPPFPELNDALHHDNLWKSRAGRKRKTTAEESPKAPRRGRGRPRKK